MDYGKGGGGPDTYTNPLGGNTPQGLQTAATMGQTLTQPQVDQAQQGVQGANAMIGQLNTQGGRQPYIDNTNLGAEQGNYDQLAQQLAQYDNLVLKPEFAGQNPNSPQDVPTGGITSAVPEFSSQAANYTPQQLLWNPNPKFGAEAQLSQADNILTLMTTLNDLMGKERSRGTAKYTSDLKAASTLLGNLTDILGQDSNLKMKKAELNNNLLLKQMELALSPRGIANNLGQEFEKVKGADGFVSPSDYQKIKRMATQYGLSGDDFDTQFSVYRNPTNPYYQLNLNPTQQTSVNNFKSSMDLLDNFQKSGFLDAKTGMAEGNIAKYTKDITGLNFLADPTLVQFDSAIGPTRDLILNAISGANVSPQEAERVKGWIPDITHSPEVNKANFQNLMDWLNSRYRSTTGSNYSSSPISPSSGGNKYTILEVK